MYWGGSEIMNAWSSTLYFKYSKLVCRSTLKSALDICSVLHSEIDFAMQIWCKEVMNSNYVSKHLASVMNRSEILVRIKNRNLIILHPLAIKSVNWDVSNCSYWLENFYKHAQDRIYILWDKKVGNLHVAFQIALLRYIRNHSK